MRNHVITSVIYMLTQSDLAFQFLVYYYIIRVCLLVILCHIISFFLIQQPIYPGPALYIKYCVDTYLYYLQRTNTQVLVISLSR